MTAEILYKINWVDILLVAILVRAVYIGIQRGVVIEIFKLAGVFLSLFITLHYFSSASKYLQASLHLPENAADLFSFSFLWGIVILVFKLIRDGFTLLIKIEAAHNLFDKWGGLFLAAMRGVLLCSMTVLCLRISSIDYFVQNLGTSLTASKFVNTAPLMYESTYNNVVSKFFPSEELNKSAFKYTFEQKETKEKKEKK